MRTDSFTIQRLFAKLGQPRPTTNMIILSSSHKISNFKNCMNMSCFRLAFISSSSNSAKPANLNKEQNSEELWPLDVFNPSWIIFLDYLPFTLHDMFPHLASSWKHEVYLPFFQIESLINQLWPTWLLVWMCVNSLEGSRHWLPRQLYRRSIQLESRDAVLNALGRTNYHRTFSIRTL